MHAVRLAGLLAAALASGACFQMTTTLKVNGDGSGTIDHRMVYSAAAIAQLRQFAMFGGRGGPSFDPPAGQQARDMTPSIRPRGPYRTTTPITPATRPGRRTAC